jgi:hypothetical protein
MLQWQWRRQQQRQQQQRQPLALRQQLQGLRQTLLASRAAGP